MARTARRIVTQRARLAPLTAAALTEHLQNQRARLAATTNTDTAVSRAVRCAVVRAELSRRAALARPAA